jgi:small-conductance mechanosensitive channel
MRNLFKLFYLLITASILFGVVQNSYAQKTDSPKVVKPAPPKAKAIHHSVRDSLRRKNLERDAMIRSFKHSDASLNDLLGKIDSYSSSYVDIKSDLDHGYDTLEISERLPLLERRMGVMRSTIEHSTTMGYIVTIRDMIDHLKSQTTDWQDQLNTYSDALDTMRVSISEFNADTTLKVIPADSALMVKCFTQIEQLKTKWAKLDKLTQQAIIKIGVLENRVSSLSILLLDLENIVDHKIQDFTLNAMTNEYGYIWDMHSTAGLDTAIIKTYTLNSKLYKYFLTGKSNYSGHIAAVVLLIVFFIWIYTSKRKLIRTKENHESILSQTNYIVKHPYLSAIAITALLAPYFYDHAVQIFIQTMLIIMMAVIGILIKDTWPKPLHDLWKSILVLTVLFTISNLMIVITNVDRVVVLLLSVAAIFVSIRFLKQLKSAASEYPPYSGMMVKGFIALQFVSIILNITGRFSLAKIAAATATFNLALALGLYLLVQMLMESLFLQLEANKRTDSTNIVSYVEFKAVQKKFKDVLIKLTALLWLVSLAKNLTIDDYLYDSIGDFLNHKYQISSAGFTFRNVLVFVLVIWISGLVARIISYFYDFSAQQTKLTPQAKKTRSSILLIRLTVFVIGFFIAVNAAGIPMSEITLIIGALGVGIGFGLQNIINNLVSGVILAFEKPIQVGDIIEVSGKTGTIKEIGIRSSKISRGDGSELIVPNGDLISQHVVNWTLSDNNRQVELIVGVAYGSDIAKVETLLKEILNGREDIMKVPEPSVLLHNFSDSSVDFKLLFWAADIGTWARLKSSVMGEIYTKFIEQGIEIPHPKRDIQIYFPEGTTPDDIAKLQNATKNPPAKDQ